MYLCEPTRDFVQYKMWTLLWSLPRSHDVRTRQHDLGSFSGTDFGIIMGSGVCVSSIARCKHFWCVLYYIPHIIPRLWTLTYASGPASVSDVANLKITASIKNVGTETLRLLNDPNSILSPWETNSFQVARAESNLVNSAPLNFTGIRVSLIII